MRLILVLLGLALLAGCDRQKPSAPQGEQPAAAAEQTAGLDRSGRGKPAPDTVFKDPDGGEISLADFQGVPTLVNLWATWCGPCVKELPTLDKLAESHAADGRLGIIAVSQDMEPQGSVKAFLDKLGIRRLGAYHDPKMALSGGLNAQVMPTTILYDAQGREVWRYVGDLDWSGPEAARLLADIPSAAPAG